MAKSAGKQNALRRVLLLFLLSVLSFHSYPSLLQLMTDISSLENFLERKAMFLLFNFILLFLAKDSGLLSTPSTAERRRRRIDDIVTAKDRHVADTDCAAIQVKEKMVQVDQESNATTVECAIEESSASSSVELVVVEEFVEEDGEGTVDVDELNRRCEEFIEMVKRTRQMEVGTKRSGMISG